MGSWQLQEAKAKLSEVIDTAEKDGPQIITRRGVETAVVVPIHEWRQIRNAEVPQSASEREKSERLLRLLQSGPQFEIPIPPRGKMRHRKPIVF